MEQTEVVNLNHDDCASSSNTFLKSVDPIKPSASNILQNGGNINLKESAFSRNASSMSIANVIKSKKLIIDNSQGTDSILEAQCSFLSNFNLGFSTASYESLKTYVSGDKPRTRKQYRDYIRWKETNKTIEACTDHFTISAFARVSPEPKNLKLACSEERRSSSPQNTASLEKRTSQEDLNESVGRYSGNAPNRSVGVGPWNNEDAYKANSDGVCNLNESMSPENCNKDEVVLSQLHTLTKCSEEDKVTSVSPNIDHLSETCLAFTSLSQKLNDREKAEKQAAHELIPNGILLNGVNGLSPSPEASKASKSKDGTKIDHLYGTKNRICSKKRVAKELFPPNLSEKSKMRKTGTNHASGPNLHALPISSSPPHSRENHAARFQGVKDYSEKQVIEVKSLPRRQSRCTQSYVCNQCHARFHLKCNLETHLITHSFFSWGLFY